MENLIKKIARAKYKKAEAAIRKLKRQADKRGVDFKYTWSKEEFEDVKIDSVIDPFTKKEVAKYVRVYFKNLSYTPIQWIEEGFELVRVVDNVEGITKHIKVVEHTHKDNHCDHCNTKRFRKTYYVLENKKDGSLVQVGRNCLSEFLGVDAEKRLNFSFLSQSFFEDTDYFDCDWKTEKVEAPRYDLDMIIRLATHYTTKYGYMSKSKAGAGDIPTSDLIVDYLFDLGDINKSEETIAQLEKETEEAAIVINRAEAAKKFFFSNYKESAFSLTVKEILEAGCISAKYIGYVACLPSMYIKHLEQQKQLKEAAKSEYVGEVKQRLEFKVQIVKSRSFEGQYGTSYLYMMKDQKGNSIKTFTNRYWPNQDEWFNIKGTIKAHEEYKGVKSTMLSRVKILEEVIK